MTAIAILVIVAVLFAWVIFDTVQEVGRGFERFQTSLRGKGARGGEGPRTPAPEGPYDQDQEPPASVRLVVIPDLEEADR